LLESGNGRAFPWDAAEDSQFLPGGDARVDAWSAYPATRKLPLALVVELEVAMDLSVWLEGWAVELLGFCVYWIHVLPTSEAWMPQPEHERTRYNELELSDLEPFAAGVRHPGERVSADFYPTLELDPRPRDPVRKQSEAEAQGRHYRAHSRPRESCWLMHRG
jgi:hypothetical protein